MRQSVHLYKHTHIAAIVTVNAFGAHGVITRVVLADSVCL